MYSDIFKKEVTLFTCTAYQFLQNYTFVIKNITQFITNNITEWGPDGRSSGPWIKKTLDQEDDSSI